MAVSSTETTSHQRSITGQKQKLKQLGSDKGNHKIPGSLSLSRYLRVQVYYERYVVNIP